MTEAAAVKSRRRHRVPAPPARKGIPLRQLLSPATAARVQPRLMVGAANDPAEREADQVAERVLSGGLREAHSPAAAAPPLARPRRSVDDQPNLDEVATDPPLPEVQQDVNLPAAEDVVTDEIGTGELGELNSGEPAAQPEGPPDPPDPPPTPEELALLERGPEPAVGPEGGEAPSAADAAIRAPGPGRPLPAPVRAEMDRGFGADFADVRLHDRPQDRATAGVLGARAFAYGRDIWLGPGERAEDRRLVAHELTHVVQQTGRGRARIMDRGDVPAPQPRRGIARLISEAVLAKVDEYARYVPGYTLLTVILGKNPITGDAVPRNAENLISGFLGLLPGGTLLVEKLRETNALAEAFDWVESQLTRLNITWTRVKAAIDRATDLFELLSPIDSITPAFTSLYDDIVTFVSAVKDKVLEFIVRGALKLAGPYAEQVWGVIQNAREAIGLILDDPLGFAKNLIRAVANGFGLFATNVLTHLKKGLLGFLFGALQGINLTLPDRLDLKGILSIVFQILGLTWENIRAIIVKKLGPKGEKVMTFIETTVDLVRILVTEGILGVWQKILGMIENLRQTVVGGIMEFVTTSLVKGAVSWLAGLSNPIGAVVKIVLAIYNFIVAFLERLQQILELANSIFTSVVEIARGNLSSAAAKVEEAIGRTVPVVLAFVAALIPVSGITAKIQSIFKSLRTPVDNAISRFIDFVIKKAKKLMAGLIARLNGKRKLPKKAFKIGRKTHHLEAVQKGGKVEVKVSSKEMTLKEAADQLAQDQAQATAAKIPPEEIEDVVRFVAAFNKNADPVDQKARQVRLDAANQLQAKPLAELDAAMTLAADDLTKFGLTLEEKNGVVTDDKTDLLRFTTPVTGFEGQAETYGTLAKKKKDQGDPPRRIELDHDPARAVIEKVQTWLKGLQKAQGKNATPVYFKPVERKDTDTAAVTAEFGVLSVAETAEPAPEFTALAIYGPHNGAMSKADASQAEAMTEFLKDKKATDAGAVKVAIAGAMKAKIKQTLELYETDPSLPKDEAGRKVVENIKIGTQNLAALANAKLKLGGADAKSTEAPSDVSGLVRKLALAGTAPNAINFAEVEGSADVYHKAREQSARTYLEADHNPMDTEMATTVGWTLGTFLDPAEEAAKVGELAEFKALIPRAQSNVQSRLGDALAEPLSFKTYSRNTGGTVVVAAEVNQDSTLTQADPNFAAGFTPKVKAAVTEQVRKTTLAKLKATTRPGRLALTYLPAVNGAIRTEMERRIRDRQQRIFSLYVASQAPEIKRINDLENPGSGDKAVGELAKIAARIKGQGTTGVLTGAVDKFFPTK